MMARTVHGCLGTLFGIFCAFAGSAEEKKFPSSGGDLASAEVWGGTLPSSDTHVVVTNAGTYTLSSAAEFASIRQQGAGEFVFDFSNAGGWFSLNGYSDATGSE